MPTKAKPSTKKAEIKVVKKVVKEVAEPKKVAFEPTVGVPFLLGDKILVIDADGTTIQHAVQGGVHIQNPVNISDFTGAEPITKQAFFERLY